MQLEFAVVCDYAGYLPTGQFVVVGPVTDSITHDRAGHPGSVSLAGTLRLRPGDREQHTVRIDATGPEKSRFTVTSEHSFEAKNGSVEMESSSRQNFALQVGAAFQTPGDYLLHVVIDGQDAKELPVHVSQPIHPHGEIRGPSLAEIEEMYQSELQEWLDLEKITPSEQVLGRIAERFTPPAEWFEEACLFEPHVERK